MISIPITKKSVSAKLKDWTRRYLPAELLGTVFALSAGVLVYEFTQNLASAAIAATWAENIGFYGYSIVREALSYFGQHRGESRWRCTWLTANKTVRSMVIEFGPAELLDSFLLRPYLMWLMPQVMNNVAAGMFVGKILADIAFYGIAIVGYEFKKKRGLV